MANHPMRMKLKSHTTTTLQKTAKQKIRINLPQQSTKQVLCLPANNNDAPMIEPGSTMTFSAMLHDTDDSSTHPVRLECMFGGDDGGCCWWWYFVLCDNDNDNDVDDDLGEIVDKKSRFAFWDATMEPNGMVHLFMSPVNSHHTASVLNLCKDVYTWLVKCSATQKTFGRWVHWIMAAANSNNTPHAIVQWYKMLRLKVKMGSFSVRDIAKHFDGFDAYACASCLVQDEGEHGWTASATNNTITTTTLLSRRPPPTPSNSSYMQDGSSSSSVDAAIHVILDAMDLAIGTNLIQDKYLLSCAMETIDKAKTDVHMRLCVIQWAVWVHECWRCGDTGQFQWALGTLGAACTLRSALKLV